MPDYIYLLENRLSADQRNALRHLREAAREAGTILFLTGDAVRDLTSGHAVRELEVSVHGNALKFKKIIEKIGGSVWGEDEESRSLYLCFPGTVRVDLLSTQRVEYKKPGQPIYHPASIQEDLRRRDFTVNAMAISLNEGSYGLLMDPLNGAADIEARTLRLVSNYGFIEEPSLLIRATRYRTRLGWELDPRSQMRYENSKGDGAIEALSTPARSQELEQIGHESEGLKVLQALEAEGWMPFLFPQWTSAKADEEKLKALHDLSVELLMQGVHADTSAAQMQLLTAKMAPKDLAALKKQLLRPGFVEEWNSLDSLAAGFAKVLLAKENTTPSTLFKLFTSYDPEAVLWLGFTSKDQAVKERFNRFLKVWPETRQHIPHALMQEMRIKPELPNYNEIVEMLFLELIDGRLSTPEEVRAFLEPYSPPAPPPQVTIKRPRGKRGEAKLKEAFDEDEDSEEATESDEDLDDMGGDDGEIGIGLGMPKLKLGSDEDEQMNGEDSDEAEEELDEDEEDEKPEPKPVKRSPKPAPVHSHVPASHEHTPKAHEVKPKTEPVKAVKPPAKPAAVPPPPAKTAAKVSAPHVPAKNAVAPAKAKTKPTPPPAKKPAPAAHAAPKVADKAKAASKTATKNASKPGRKTVGLKVAPPKHKAAPVKVPKAAAAHKPSGKKPAKLAKKR